VSALRPQRSRRLPYPRALIMEVSRRCAIPSIPVKKNAITAFIGPSGCGKSTVLRCLNRMNDLVRGFRFRAGTCAIADAISTMPPSTRSPCAASLEWSSSSPIRSPPASTTTWPSGCASTDYKGDKAEKVEQALRAAASVGRSEGQAPARAASRFPAGSSSASASRAPSPPSPRCC
jgi:hypothetical protein